MLQVVEIAAPSGGTPGGASGDLGMARPDSGESLLEVIITIMLVSTVMLCLLTATLTTIRVSSVSRSAARLETAIVNVADRVNRAPKRCDYLVYAQAAVQTEGWSPSAASMVQEYYTPGANPTTPGTWTKGPADSPACPYSSPADLLVQRLTITLTSPDGKVTKNIQVVKSDV